MITKPWLVPLWHSNTLLGISSSVVLIESDNLYIKHLDDFILQTITSKDHFDLYICVIDLLISLHLIFKFKLMLHMEVTSIIATYSISMSDESFMYQTLVTTHINNPHET